MEYDVIIIGAGLAGLSAGKGLNENGVRYKIIEANSRPGGKVYSREYTGRYFELGGQFINQDMTEMTRLVKDAGMEIHETDVTEDAVIIDERKNTDVESILKADKKLFKGIGERDIRLSRLYEKYIADSYHRKLISSQHSELLNINPELISSKAIAAMMDRYISSKSDTTHQASGPLNNVVSYLERFSKDKIMYGQPVAEIAESKDGYIILSSNNEYRSKAVILAIPPTAASQITYTPGLPEKIENALKSFKDGAVIKITWVFEEAFWRSFSVQNEVHRLKEIIYSEPEGITVSDSSKSGDENRLTMFIGGDTAIKLADKTIDERLEYAVSLLTEVLGEKARYYIDREESVWVNAPYTGGGYSASVLYTGIFNAAQILRQPYKKLLFSSSELSPDFPKFMEGAVRSGKHTAKKALELLK
ncbi:FAD-dependent oxidoreductase [Evansella sp. LMS18]|uniref:flavin monoamine oxidase family protein n=1 Tax=Evansella sp. LMS18 TaxID=2924033 RepID=UPI0020D07D0D|nr:FAD-dependent oxidoreductase [Evansella sp. LMS18]UTR10043.1 FAD-dependent oxidoreductase [Evansella sp. LMS18]